MNRLQFSIRQMLIATTAVATSIVVLPLVVQHAPFVLVAAMILAAIAGLLGLAVVAFAGLLALFIYASEEDVDRQENLRRCVSLVVFGFAMCVPLLLMFAITWFLGRY